MTAANSSFNTLTSQVSSVDATATSKQTIIDSQTATATQSSEPIQNVVKTKKAPADPITAPERLWLKIDDRWFDLTKWQKQHPGGPEILQHLQGQDATDAFYSLHSKEAHTRLNKLWSIPATPENDHTKPPTQATINFRKWRKQLDQEGWFDKDPKWEVFYHSSVYVLALIGTYFALFADKTWMSYLISFLCVSLSMEQSGWIAHDYTHLRGKYARCGGRMVGGFINAFSTSWWSDKHNTHHVYTNHMGIDRDIENDPVIHLAFPTEFKDVWYRKLQHIYLMPVLSLLFVSWRTQSLQYAWSTRNYTELFMQTCNYTWLLLIGLKISIPAVLFAGFLVAVIVTATHQSEEIVIEQPTPLTEYSFVECQFATTRDVWMTSSFMNWLWGGMQYQLEHHLFPIMPKYRYRKLIPQVKQFAKDNQLEYKVDTLGQILKRNYETIKFYSGEKKEDVLKVPKLKLTPSAQNLQQLEQMACQERKEQVAGTQALSEQISEDLDKTKQAIETNLRQRVGSLRKQFATNAPNYPLIVSLTED